MQTLKGNIRVFCRVRPVGPADKASADRLESGRPVMVLPQPGGPPMTFNLGNAMSVGPDCTLRAPGYSSGVQWPSTCV